MQPSPRSPVSTKQCTVAVHRSGLIILKSEVAALLVLNWSVPLDPAVTISDLPFFHFPEGAGGGDRRTTSTSR